MPNGINLFFSNDQNEKRSELFVKANHPQGDFSVGADPTSDDLQSIMLASNMINFDETRQNKNDIAAIIMDPIRSKLPENNFLLSVKELDRENNIIMIFILNLVFAKYFFIKNPL